jgi:hypothetical protein
VYFDDRVRWLEHADDELRRLGGPTGTEPVDT